MGSELVTPNHLKRRAVVYVRQSTPHQVITNQECLRLQYALRQRARELGWRDADVEVVDADLGLSGAAAAHRLGFKDLVARVALGEIGLILSTEVTRLARNCSDWYPLLDVCGHRGCLIADRDGVYDAGTPNGRLLLGLKGTISELELHNYLRQQYGGRECQSLRAAPIDAQVAAAFLEAVAPAEFDAWARARKAQRQADEALRRAEEQQIERLRYQAALAERQFNRVDPDNRLVAAELERRWEAALVELRRAENELASRRTAPPAAEGAPVPPRLRAQVIAIGQRLPEVWADPGVRREHRKALLRCLIEKVVMRRADGDRAMVRIVWRGGAVTELEVKLPVTALAALPRHREMVARVRELALSGVRDTEIARRLTAEGHRSPGRAAEELPNTVRGIRRRQGIKQIAEPTRWPLVAGYLTITQATARLGLPKNWLRGQIRRGAVRTRRETSGRYLFPDGESTFEALRQLREKTIRRIDLTRSPPDSRGHQDA
jgi:hypothetical protein